MPEQSVAQIDDVLHKKLKQREYYLRYTKRKHSLEELYEAARTKTEKACSRCGIVKPMTEFVRSSKARDGRAAECSICMRKRTDAWKKAKQQKAARERELAQLKDFLPGHKRCCRCKNQRPLSAFGKVSKSKDGLQHACRECMKPTISAANRKWHKSHPEHMRRLRRAAYRRAHPGCKTLDEIRVAKAVEKLKRQAATEKKCTKCGTVKSIEEFVPCKRAIDGRTWQCRDCLRERQKKWEKEHAQATIAKVRRWQGKNPDKTRHISQVRRARKKEVPGAHTLQEWLELCASFDHRCVRCGGHKKLTRDHIIPLSNPNSSHDIANIQPLCYSCNSSKNNRHSIDYRPYAHKGVYLGYRSADQKKEPDITPAPSS